MALYQGDLAKILVALFMIGVTLSVYQCFLEWAGQCVKKAWAR
jgi:NitT/TauT family transport system permease protein